MTDVCYPPSTDWSCRWTEAELEQQRADPVMGPKIETAEAFAWSLLAALTMYRIGTCPLTVRPCAARCAPRGAYRTAVVRGGNTAALPTAQIGMLNPYISGGTWLNACGCRTAGDCGCESLSTVELPGPVGSIVEVRLDGAVLPRSAYRVMNGNRLVRTDGENWPACQDMANPGVVVYAPIAFDGPGGRVVFTRDGQTVTVSMQPSGANAQITGGSVPWGSQSIIVTDYPGVNGHRFMVDSVGSFNLISAGNTTAWSFSYETGAEAAPGDTSGTFEVTYYRGAAPNRMTNAAAGALANEFLKACDGDSSCRLPYNVTSASRSGETYEFDQSDFADGDTGIPEVQALIRIYNPNRLKSPVIVASPDDYITPARTA